VEARRSGDKIGCLRTEAGVQKVKSLVIVKQVLNVAFGISGRNGAQMGFGYPETSRTYWPVSLMVRTLSVYLTLDNSLKEIS
jgi:lipid-binding SYLF domain-containing protein